MNKNIVITISVIIIITIIAFSLTQISTIEEENNSYMEVSNEIQPVLEKIKQDKIKNDNLDNPYVPKEREWISSGPFLIDRSEYVLGEKIFVNIQNLPENIKGEMIFVKYINSTHHQPYKTIGFDGSLQQNNFYLGVYPSLSRGFCTADSLIGEWELIFQGVPIESLKFKFVNQILPGMEENFRPVC